MIGALISMIPNMFKLGGKLIQDADKRAEYAFKVQEMMQDFMKTMLQTKTYPWVDGVVKLAYAGDAIVKGLIRPLAAGGMMVYAIYAQTHGIVLPEAVEIMLYGALPAWGVDRGLDKRKKKKEEAFDEDW